MTPNLDNAGGQRLEHGDQRSRCDGRGIRLARAVVTVELATEHDPGIEMSNGNAEVARNPLEDRPRAGLAVTVMMRVEMRRVATHQRAKLPELLGDVGLYQSLEFFGRRGARPRASLDAPAAELDMQSDTERGAFARILGGLGSRFAVHHQAGARDNSALMGLDDPSVHTAAEPEVVGIDDDEPHVGHHSR